MSITGATTDINISKPVEADQSAKMQERLSKLRKASVRFEAILLKYMLKTMRETIPEGGLLKRELANEFYESLFDEEVSLRLASGQTGSFADMIFRQLSGKLRSGTPVESLLNGIDSLNRKDKQPVLPTKLKSFVPIVTKAADRHGLDPRLILAVIDRESGGDRLAVSSKGAKGLMQLMDSTAASLGVRDSFDPEENIMGGSKYLKQLMTQFDNELELALAAYNAGLSNVRRYGGIPPYAETRDYVKSVMQTYSILRADSWEGV